MKLTIWLLYSLSLIVVTISTLMNCRRTNIRESQIMKIDKFDKYDLIWNCLLLVICATTLGYILITF